MEWQASIGTCLALAIRAAARAMLIVIIPAVLAGTSISAGASQLAISFANTGEIPGNGNSFWNANHTWVIAGSCNNVYSAFAPGARRQHPQQRPLFQCGHIQPRGGRCL